MNEQDRKFIKNNYGEYINSLLDEYLSNESIINSSPILTETILSIVAENRKIKSELNLLDIFNTEIFTEMANLGKADTGLDFVIWIDEEGAKRNLPHNLARLKVRDPDDSKNYISVLISQNPEILAGKFKNKQNLTKLFQFIIQNYNELMRVWNNQVNVRNMKIKKV